MAVGGYEDWMARGRAHQGEGRLIDAILCYHRAARADPRASDPHFAIGELQWRLGRLPEAVAAWREASRIVPSHMAPVQAEAEALLAMGDTEGAVAQAKRVQALLPQDARAALIRGVGALLGVDPGIPHPAAAINELLARNPSLLAIPTLAGPLALALERAPVDTNRGAILDRLVCSPEALQNSAPQLLVAALEHAAGGFAADEAARERLAAIACAHNFAPGDHEFLRRAARAVATFDVMSGRVLAKLYALLCVYGFGAPVSLLWPVRTAGGRWRIVVLAPAGAAGTPSLAAICNLAGDRFDITLATIGTTPVPPMPGVQLVALPEGSDMTAARILSARDPDILVDLAGLAAPTGPLLARRPARTIVGVGSMPVSNEPPLLDHVAAGVSEIIAMLGADQDGHDFTRDCPVDVGSLAKQWDEAVHAHQGGDRAKALARYARVLALEPGFAPAMYLTGIAHRDDGDVVGALTAFSDALAAVPGYADARVAAMRAATALGNHDRAIALGEEGRALAPGNAAMMRALGQALLAHREGPAAAAAFSDALGIDPTDGETHYHQGVALQMAGEIPEAARAYQRALAFRPDLAQAHFNLGVLFQKQGLLESAAEAFSEVLRRDSGNVAAWKYLGEVFILGGSLEEMLAHFRRFEARHPNALPLAVQALEACQYLADFDRLEFYIDGLRNDRFVVADEIVLIDVLEQLLYLLLYFDVEQQLLHKLAQSYDAAAKRVYGLPLPRIGQRRPGPLRIGYLSADLRNHVMGKMVWSAVEHHDRARFELYFYSLSPVDDDWTARFRAIAHKFVRLDAAPEREAARAIARDDLDVLVDLSTHTKGARPGILALKPARVQITHVASSGTVGLSTIDFKLTDRYADVPESNATQLEVLLPMDGCLYPYRHIEAAAEHPFHRERLGIAAETVVIGVFVSALKLSRRCLSLWRDVLGRIPAAKLAFSPITPQQRQIYVRLAGAAGIAADRLLFLPQGRDEAENQARYTLVDFVLDTMPYGGVNGVLEPIDACVPVVTLVGRRHGERTAYTILANLGVTETVAQSGREYVDIAARLATDPKFMHEVRERIRTGLAHSPLTDEVGHTRALERAYIEALAQRTPEALAAAGVSIDG